jgi:hypothetical protein
MPVARPATMATSNGALGNCTTGKRRGQPSWVSCVNHRRRCAHRAPKRPGASTGWSADPADGGAHGTHPESAPGSKASRRTTVIAISGSDARCVVIARTRAAVQSGSHQPFAPHHGLPAFSRASPLRGIHHRIGAGEAGPVIVYPWRPPRSWVVRFVPSPRTYQPERSGGTSTSHLRARIVATRSDRGLTCITPRGDRSVALRATPRKGL